MMKKSKSLRSKIDKIETELEKLQERKIDIQQSLNELTEGISAMDRTNGVMDEVRSLKTDKDVLQDVIQRKQEKKAELEEKLDSVIGKETKEDNFKRLVSLAERSAELQNEYYSAAKAVDEVLKNKMDKFLDARKEWLDNNRKFISLADQIAPGFKSATHIVRVRNDRKDELKAKEMIQRLEAEGVDMAPLTDGEIMDTQFHNFVTKYESKPDLIFSKTLHRLTRTASLSKRFRREKKESES